jgi:hypothetical protein
MLAERLPTLNKPQLIKDNVHNAFFSGMVMTLYLETQALAISSHTDALILMINDRFRFVYAVYKFFNYSELIMIR